MFSATRSKYGRSSGSDSTSASFLGKLEASASMKITVSRIRKPLERTLPKPSSVLPAIANTTAGSNVWSTGAPDRSMPRERSMSIVPPASSSSRF